jgi:transposase
MRTQASGLEEAFRYFGGVPQDLLFDQMKAVITRSAVRGLSILVKRSRRSITLRVASRTIRSVD